jgi:hypothetical protein
MTGTFWFTFFGISEHSDIWQASVRLAFDESNYGSSSPLFGGGGIPFYPGLADNEYFYELFLRAGHILAS